MNFMFQHLDNKLFELINQKWVNPNFDFLMIYFSQVKNWYLFYSILVVVIFLKRRHDTWRWLIVAYLNMFLIYEINNQIVKKIFQQIRPCDDTNLISKIRLLVDHCPDNFGFTSMQSSINFGFIFFLYFTNSKILSKYMLFFIFMYVIAISYSQIYIGVHYPKDVLGGAVLGSFVSFITARLYLLNFKTK
jgi:membrane-associated phospholipid phosphatase